MLLNIIGLEVFYGKVHAVKGVNLQVNDGEFVAIIGSNGAGKSTTVNAISGVVDDKRGEIWFDGERIDNLSAPKIVRKGVIQVPEGRRVFPTLTVLENLKMGGCVHHDRKKEQKQFEVVCHLFPLLKERLGQKGQTLSGGEQQMLAIGRALMAAPRLLLLDEPSLGLSPLLTGLVAKELSQINQAGTSIALIEQNARLALHLARRGYVMELGSVLLEGASRQLEEIELVRKAYLGL